MKNKLYKKLHRVISDYYIETNEEISDINIEYLGIIKVDGVDEAMLNITMTSYDRRTVGGK